MDQLMRGQIAQLRSRLESMTLQMKYASPENQLNMRLQYMMDLEDRMTKRMEQLLSEARHRMQLLAQRLESGSPLRKLSAGYSLVTDEQGNIVNDFERIETGMVLTLHMLDGDVKTRVEEKQCRK